MRKFRSYYLFCLTWLLPFFAIAQTDQIVIKKVPFVDNDNQLIYQTLQDTSGFLNP